MTPPFVPPSPHADPAVFAPEYIDGLTGRWVMIFLASGAVVCGRLLCRKGNVVELLDEREGKNCVPIGAITRINVPAAQ